MKTRNKKVKVDKNSNPTKSTGREDVHICLACDRGFKSFVYLQKHLNSSHRQLITNSSVENDEENTSTEETVRKYQCKHCDETFSRNFGLKRHLKRLHGQEAVLDAMDSGNGICLQCNIRFRRALELRTHLIEKHQFSNRIDEFTFHSQEEFLSWKDEMQKETHSIYNRVSRNVKDSIVISYYICNRSGNYRSMVKGDVRQRKEKKGGSVKSNMLCTSSIKCTTSKDGKIQAELFPAHYGHDIRPLRASNMKEKRPYKRKTTNGTDKPKKCRMKKAVDTLENEEIILQEDADQILENFEQNSETENLDDIITLKRRLISTLWEISCEVEKCNRREPLIHLYHSFTDLRQLLTRT